jgi:hypothetical protein
VKTSHSCLLPSSALCLGVCLGVGGETYDGRGSGEWWASTTRANESEEGGVVMVLARVNRTLHTGHGAVEAPHRTE